MNEKKNLKELRFEKNITQLELYLKCGMNMARISLLENGKYVPTDDEKRKLAEAIGISAEDVKWPRLAEDSP